MMLDLHGTLRARLLEALERTFQLAPEDCPPITVQTPPNRVMGDLAVTVAFELARVLCKAPRAIAQELMAALGSLDGVARIEAAPNGYLNFHLDRAAFLRARLGATDDEAAASPPGAAAKTIVEHTAINPNKAAHIGHLRNAALGDTLSRLLRFQGTRVEVQNYIDDTGVQVADVVVGLRELEGLGIDGVRHQAAQPRFDFFCWDLYARVTDWYQADNGRLTVRAAALHDIERGDTECAEMGQIVADRIVRCHLATMARLDIDYDLLTWEGDILRLHFWSHAFDLLKQSGAVFLQTEGPLAGCWVMRIDEGPIAPPSGTSDAAASEPEATLPDEPDSREKVIVRSDGTVTYVGKDIAYQFWKFGLLGRDFHYRVFDRRTDGRPLWATSTAATAAEPPPPPFGDAVSVYNVIDTRQSYLQKLLVQALRAMRHDEQAERSIHFSYEMVALSPATALALGYTLPDQHRGFVEVSGRKGLGVKADDLLDRLQDAAAAEVAARNPGLEPDACREIAGVISTAALRYFMIKYTRGKVIAFDIDEALSFEGESGPYLQYAVVRANNIFAKLQERSDLGPAAVVAAVSSADPTPLAPGEGDTVWALVLEAARLDEVAAQAVRTLELSVLAKWAFGLAQAFNAFYHRAPILNEPDRGRQLWRAAAALYFRDQMTRALALMGCRVPPRM